MPRPYFYDKHANIDEILRVDHAGEYGAIRIYEGQLRVIKDPMIEEMLAQEQKHLEYFANAMRKNSTRPTMLMPIWNVFGYAMGALSARLGRKYAMLCTEAVEEVIDEHYKEQHKMLVGMREKDLANKVEQHRLEELEHKAIAVEQGSSDTFLYPVLKSIISAFCRLAIFGSKVA